MKKWIVKAVAQKGISLLPFSKRINYFMQRKITRGLWLTDTFFRERIQLAKRHLESCEHKPSTTLEIGTGWHPIVPVAFFLAGVENIHSCDHVRHLNRQTISETLDFFVGPGRAILEAQGFPIIDERFQQLVALQKTGKVDPDELLSELHIHTHLLKSGNISHLADESFDLIHSNNTLAHIYDNKLIPLIAEMARLLRPTGVLSHHIDLCDHFAHVDPSISILHFLKYTDNQWKWIDNNLQAQSRNRLSDYVRLFHQAGFTVRERKSERAPIDALATIRLAERFRTYPESELLITHTHLVGQKTTPSP